MRLRKSKILIVDDDRSLSEILINLLEYDGYTCDVSNDGRSALAKIECNDYDLVILDLKLPDINGMMVLEKARGIKPKTQIVMISGQGTINMAVKATHLGAYDFLEKPLDSERVLVTLKNALARGRLEKEKAHLLESVKEQYKIIGESQAVQTIHHFIQKAASTDSKVLIKGENGTGKELIARAIYFNSARSGEPFIVVNCAAIPETLIESELFGHKKGAFTGAVSDKLGRFQMADGGTLFLDEIGDMSLLTQAKVLRVLEEGIIEMIGGVDRILTDVRIIVATNKDLNKEMENGTFREDLFFRLNVLTIDVPPLRERRDDIVSLIKHFMHNSSDKHGIALKTITSGAMASLNDYHWPGNIRELRNVIEKLMVLVDDEEIQAYHVTSVLKGYSVRGINNTLAVSFKEARKEFETTFIQKKLVENHWNITKTAYALDMPRTYLYKKMKSLGIHP